MKYCSDPNLVARKADILLAHLLYHRKHLDVVHYLSLLFNDDISPLKYCDLLVDLGVSHED